MRAELASGLASPPEDLELRRELQMRRLLTSMGQGAAPVAGELDALTLEWLAVGPVEPGPQDVLQARFERTLDAD